MSKLVHDKECQTCKRLFACNGKPVDVKNCVNYKMRVVKEEKKWTQR